MRRCTMSSRSQISRRRLLEVATALGVGGLLAMNDVGGQVFRVAAARAGAPMQTSELWRASAHELVDALRAKAVSSREVIEAHLARIAAVNPTLRSEEHTSELQSRQYLVCRLLLEKKKTNNSYSYITQKNIS